MKSAKKNCLAVRKSMFTSVLLVTMMARRFIPALHPFLKAPHRPEVPFGINWEDFSGFSLVQTLFTLLKA
jgi:hypothetical protein